MTRIFLAKAMGAQRVRRFVGKHTEFFEANVCAGE